MTLSWLASPLETILRAIFFAAILMLSVILHEWAHMIFYTRQTGRKIKLRFKKGEFICGSPNDYKYLTTEQYKYVLWAGVIAGFIPLFIFWEVLHSIEFLLLLILYIIGCKSDLKILWNLK